MEGRHEILDVRQMDSELVLHFPPYNQMKTHNECFIRQTYSPLEVSYRLTSLEVVGEG